MSGEVVRVLMVDDNPDDVSIIQRLLGQYRRASFQLLVAYTPSRGLECLETEGADVLLLDYSMPSEDGLSFLRRVSELVDMPPVIVVTGQSDYRLAAEAVRSGAFDCIYKYGMTPQTLGRSLQQAMDSSRHETELSRFDDRVVDSLLRAAAQVDPEYAGERVALLSLRLGAAIGLHGHQLNLLHYAGLLHDIGKLGVSGDILTKPERLTPDEEEEVRLHPVIGERICASLRLAKDLCPIIRHHHERWDGDGYVDGLAGRDIPLLARVVASTDAFDAMTSELPYSPAMTGDEAISLLRRGAGSEWDPELVRIFIEMLAVGPSTANATGDEASLM